MKKNVIILMVMLATIVAVPMVAMAQSDPVDTPPGTGAGGEPDGTAPIDGGLSLLVAAGVGYGAKKLKEKKTNRSENSKV